MIVKQVKSVILGIKHVTYPLITGVDYYCFMSKHMQRHAVENKQEESVTWKCVTTRDGHSLTKLTSFSINETTGRKRNCKKDEQYNLS